MALYKLSDGTSSVDISPIRGLNIPETRVRQQLPAKEGHHDTYEFGDAEKYEIPLIDLTKARADILLGWWEDMEVLTFTPDQGAPGTTIQMIIDGIDKPLNMWHKEFDTRYAGMVGLCEVSSQSFSSSEISTSKSVSCSSFDAGSSLGFESSKSCSTFLAATSNSSSVGFDDSYSTSRSCSESLSWSEQRSCSEFSAALSPSIYLTFSSCADLSSSLRVSSCENQSSLGSSQSTGVITLDTFSQSCSLNPSSSSFSESAAGQSCSISAGGIS